MLQSIRSYSQGWLAWTIVIIICITFGLWGIHSYTNFNANRDLIATVNGQPVNSHQVNAVYEQLRRQQQLELGLDFSLNPANEAQLKKQALNQLIVSQVLGVSLFKSGYRVTTSQGRDALLRIPAFQENGQFSRNRFEEIIASMGYSIPAFLDQLRKSMLIDQVQAGFVQSAFYLPQDINDAIKLVDQKRDVAFLTIPFNNFLKDITVPDAVAQSYYKQHQNEFATPEQMSIQYLELSLQDLMNGLHFDNAKLEQYYKDNLDSFTTPTRWRIARILIKAPLDADEEDIVAARTKITNVEKQIKAGEDFSKLAEEYSEDPRTAKDGGVTGWLSLPTITPAIGKMASELKAVGDVSPIFRTDDGFNIIKLVEREAPQVQPFEKVQDQVSKALAQQQAGQIFAEKSDKLANLAYIHPNSLDDTAKEVGLTLKTTELFSRQGGKAGITANPKVVLASFNPDVLGRGNNSDLIELSPDTLIVLRLKDHVAAGIRPFAEVQNTIRNIIKADIAQQKAKELANIIVLQLQKGVSGKQLAKQYDFTWEFKPEVGRYDTKIEPAILNRLSVC